ncbi:AMP-binding protein [Streptomyces sp. NPDC003077]|uniref:class I adenylate-forming enzyme family protein n=1 Tax=Streptomyces sp. NPDC003077 TaxID=3154443 RepID=UPI0033B685B4
MPARPEPTGPRPVFGRVPDDPAALAHVPDVPLDGLLRRAAAAVPDRTALHTPEGQVTYAALDAAVDGGAAVLARAAGGRGAVVGVVSSLTASFAIAYYGAVRAGLVVAIINPFLREDALAHALTSASVSVLVAPPEVAARVERIRDRLPGPVAVLPPGEVTRPGPAPGGPAPDPGAVVCLQFTSGTTGDPKTVRLTHRNLVVNAAQIAAVHRLDSTSVTLNHLPLFHPMHLNSAVWAGATQVPVPDPDPAAAIEAANRHRASHFYSLPVRLAHLAADPRLPGLRLRTVGTVFSGGSALLPAPARKLADHFGIPVVQGYGLAETSPLTHCQRPSRPVPGSVGAVVPGTECRVVDIDTRAPLPAGRPGEVQVRGPQVMHGYLGSADPAVDADGWFSTGDVGYEDAAGNLFLTDRLKDVFKYENWVVSPTEIEQVLIGHPAVRDCAVVDHPDPYRGAVAHAFVVLAADTEGAARPAPADIAAHVARRLPYYQHLKYIDAVDDIPRSPNGKILRRVLRDRIGGSAQPPSPAPSLGGPQ